MLFGVSLMFMGLADLLLVFGILKRIKLMIQIWVALSIVIVVTIGIFFACIGIWEIIYFVIFYTIPLILAMRMIKKMEEEKTNHSEMTNLTNNMDGEAEIGKL